jgi:hypothetical protein
MFTGKYITALLFYLTAVPTMVRYRVFASSDEVSSIQYMIQYWLARFPTSSLLSLAHFVVTHSLPPL